MRCRRSIRILEPTHLMMKCKMSSKKKLKKKRNKMLLINLKPLGQVLLNQLKKALQSSLKLKKTTKSASKPSLCRKLLPQSPISLPGTNLPQETSPLRKKKRKKFQKTLLPNKSPKKPFPTWTWTWSPPEWPKKPLNSSLRKALKKARRTEN